MDAGALSVAPSRTRSPTSPLFRALAAGILVLSSGVGGAEARNVIHLSGYVWEDGGFPKSVFGDELHGVGVLNRVEAPLYWVPEARSYTWYMRGLISMGASLYGTTQVVEYASGFLTIYVDVLPSNHDYGVFPPNSTVPSTFTDGFAAYLDGFFTEFVLTYDAVSSSGSFTGSLVFTGGNVFPQLQSSEGWTLGSDISDLGPPGYDLSMNGNIHLAGPLGLKPHSWGAVKSLYR